MQCVSWSICTHVHAFLLVLTISAFVIVGNCCVLLCFAFRSACHSWLATKMAPWTDQDTQAGCVECPLLCCGARDWTSTVSFTYARDVENVRAALHVDCVQQLPPCRPRGFETSSTSLVAPKVRAQLMWVALYLHLHYSIICSWFHSIGLNYVWGREMD